MSAKYIFVTGGVVSSIGKGITVASIGRILKNRGFNISVIKLDPYLNVDPGTMSPYQHGEVFVTEDGGETDLDLGHYERFIDIQLNKNSNVTAGQVYLSLITKERKGDFLGGTIQTIPHVTNEIKHHITDLAESLDVDVMVVEVGGTVGDIEGLPFLEAIRQLRNDVGRENVYFIHLTLLPNLNVANELKTKPTQHSVSELRSIGIQPDALICRSQGEVPDFVVDKLSLFCDVKKEEVIPLTDVDNVYRVPMILEGYGLGNSITKSLGLPPGSISNTSSWSSAISEMDNLEEIVRIALVGKYVEYPDAYMSVREAMTHAGLQVGRKIQVKWVHSEDLERDGAEQHLSDVDGIVVPGGFGKRGVEGMILAAEYARLNNIPYLGLCLGMQVMIIEWCRNVLNLFQADSEEFVPETPNPVIHVMPDQIDVTNKGGTMRLGVYPCNLDKTSKSYHLYAEDSVEERHRHRFELNNSYREAMEESGICFAGLSPDGTLVEIAESSLHDFMIGVQFHPEFRSRPNSPHPLFVGFLDSVKQMLREGAQFSFNEAET
ncbi:MAG: CTP synthase [Dehalococcoidia bacterium]